MEISNKIRNKIREFLKITDASVTNISVEAAYTHGLLCNLEEIMYRSDPKELEEAFKSLNFNNSMFWASVPSSGRKIRKKSAHMFPDILDRQNNILISSMNKPTFANAADEALFDEIFSYNNGQSFQDIIQKVDLQTMLKGDCFLKATIDTELSQYPIIEVVPSDKAEPVYKRNILDSIIFYTEYKLKHKSYILKETYGKGFIKYTLFDDNDKEVPLNTIEELATLQDITFQGDFFMATYIKYWDSPRFEHRGNPLITDFDSFDSLDEALSLWSSGLRKSQPNRYIPSAMIPRNENGQMMKPNDFDNDFIAINGSMGEGNDKIEVSQPMFDYASYETSVVNFKLECMRAGKISPVSMAVDRSKYEDNATADRQKEKMTEWTRAQRIDKLMIFIPEMVNMIFNTYANMTGGAIMEHEVEASFDEFSSPNIEDIIDVISKAAPGTKIISNATIVEMTAKALNKDDEWQKTELEALNSETSMVYEEAPLFKDDEIEEEV